MSDSPAAPPIADDVFRRLETGIDCARTLGLPTAAADAAAAGHDTAGAAAALAELAGAAGITRPTKDLVTERLRRRATLEAIRELAELLDMDGLERGALAVTVAQARREGSGPLRPIAVAMGRGTEPPPEPAAHLGDWRSRGRLTDVAATIGSAVRESLPSVPPALRSSYAGAFDADELAGRLATSLDGMLARESHEAAAPPTTRAWERFSRLLWVDAVVLFLAVAWIAIAVLAGQPIPAYPLPFLGRVSVPGLMLVVGIAVGVVLVTSLRRHADALGRLWGRRLEVVARIGAREVIEAEAFTTIDRLESARVRLAEMVLPGPYVFDDQGNATTSGS